MVSPLEFANRAFHYQYKLWENQVLILCAVITYIYLCGWHYASCLSYISNRPSVMDLKLNWNVTRALEKPFTIGVLSYTDSWRLVPFSRNVSWDHSDKAGLCFNEESESSVVCQITNNIILRSVGFYFFGSGIHSKNIPIQSSLPQIYFL
jgi:hypothetical protein